MQDVLQGNIFTETETQSLKVGLVVGKLLRPFHMCLRLSTLNDKMTTTVKLLAIQSHFKGKPHSPLAVAPPWSYTEM